MKKVYVCSPLSAPTTQEVAYNIDRARKYCRKLSLQDIIPYAPHTYFTEFLDDNSAYERALGMKMGMNWLTMCDEVHVLGTAISYGMGKEIERASILQIPIVFVTESEEG